MTLYVEQAGGDHYKSRDQHWDLMDRWDVEYLPATASKYVVRYDRKGTPKLDLDKAITYLEKQLACHPNKGCRRLIPYEAMQEWCVDNKIEGKKRLLMVMIHCQGTVNSLHRAIDLIKDVIDAEHAS